jgi:hypothetical protein
MYVEMRPIGRILSSCIPEGLWSGYLRVHEKKMRHLFVHEELLSRRGRVARQRGNAMANRNLSAAKSADHGAAWSKGGETSAANGQMLCKPHNCAKGNR